MDKESSAFKSKALYFVVAICFSVWFYLLEHTKVKSKFNFVKTGHIDAEVPLSEPCIKHNIITIIFLLTYLVIYDINSHGKSYQSLSFLTQNSNELLRVIIEVWKIHPPEGDNYPDGMRFSIVAFLDSHPDDAIIVDCHPPKGPHFHIDGKEEIFEWKDMNQTEELFWNLVEKKFGSIKE